MNEASVGDMVRTAGKDAVLREAESFGLDPRGLRMRCPWAGCQDKGPDRDRDAAAYDGGKGHFRIKCHACGETGDLVDLMQRARGLTKEEAIASLRGPSGYASVAQAAPRRPLRLVGNRPAHEEGKLLPAEVKRIWDSLAASDELGEEYLRTRRMHQAVSAGLVKFAREDSTHKNVSGLAKGGWRTALLASDVTGQPRGIQLRLSRQAKQGEPKVLSVSGSATGRSFFGSPADIEAADVIAVAEGMFDYLTVATWAPPHVCCVGAPGKGALPRLAEELELAGIGVEGKLFALFVQNDRPPNKSRQEFVRLGSLLADRGARIVYVSTPREFDDVGDWRKANSEAPWPPRELEAALRGQEESSAATKDAEQGGGSRSNIEIPSLVRVDALYQDFGSLLTLLDSPDHRPNIVGDGEFWFDELSGLEMFGDKPVRFPADILTVKLRLEGIVAANSGKKLRFSKGEIEDAVCMLCARQPRHPVRTYLDGLPAWDGRSRIEDFALALGASEPMALVYLRRWLISAVARALRPGCKVDTVLVLTGGQGAAKSSVFETLGGVGFTDSPMDIRRPEALRQASMYWIIEWAELDAIREREVETVKAFLSSREDTYRLPYARTMTTTKRRGVIVATTNRPRFLSDATGSRRFWVVATGDLIDLLWVRENRDQLWAEAKALLESREQWWLTAAEDAERDGQAARHDDIYEDPWLELVSEWLAGAGESNPTAKQLLSLAIGKVEGLQTRADYLRVARIMRALGWEGPAKIRCGDVDKKAYRRKV